MQTNSGLICSRFSGALAVAAMLFAATPGSVAGTCTDADADGYWVEPGCGSTPDCNDSDPSIHPGSFEFCDGFDNDCDGQIDNDVLCDTICDAPGQIGDNSRITTNIHYSEIPALVWNGSGYGVAWTETFFTNFVRFDSTGVPIGSPTMLGMATGGGTIGPSLVWTGSEYLAAVVVGGGNDEAIDVVRFDATGTLIGGPVTITEPTIGMTDPALAWTGSGFGLVWADLRDGLTEIYFARLDASGNKIGLDVRVTNASQSSQEPSIVWTGSSFSVAWRDFRDGDLEIYFARLDAAGSVIGSEVRVTNVPGASYSPSLVWNGSGHAIAWEDGRDGNREIYFARLDAVGNKLGSDVRITNDPALSTFPSLVWSGAEYGVAWTDVQAQRRNNFARIDASGTKLGGDLLVSDGDGNEDHPFLVWVGSEYAIAWDDDRDSSGAASELYFTRIGCDCLDGDSDGSSVCEDCDDGDPAVFPGATQLCDGINNDCDDPLWPAVPMDEIDGDGDGYTPCAGDCDDMLSTINPDGFEICNTRDDDCDGLTDEDANGLDADADGVPGLCDNCPTDPNADQADMDADTIGDLCDNCIADPNQSQSDFDSDFVGDRCDDDDGVIYTWFDTANQLDWQSEGFAVWNAYRGDLDELRFSTTYTQAPGSNALAAQMCGLTSPVWADSDAIPPGLTAFYLSTGDAGVETDLGQDSSGNLRPNDNPCP